MKNRMKNRLLSMILALALCLTLLPTAALAADPPEEQFTTLTPGETYWFDLSGVGIPGTVNEGNYYGAAAVPDKTLRWVPFTYAGTVDAYVLKSRSADDNTAKGDSVNAAGSTDPTNPIGYTYDHSLFIADYGVTHTVSWDELNEKGLIFGTTYTSGGVDYTLRAPSAGSSGDTGTALPGTPASNEWDAILDKNSGYIKNIGGMYSWGQDTYQDDASERAQRGYESVRNWDYIHDTHQGITVVFRPVLELPSTDTLGSDSLTTVTLDLNGGSIGTVEGHITTGEIHLVTKKGESYTAPSSDGLTRPDGNDGAYFKWQDSSGKLYEPGDTVPADVASLTALWEVPEQFTTLTPGETYWFDLSGAGIPGDKNEGNNYGAVAVPDTTLHWVPFTYAGTVDAYVLKSRSGDDNIAKGDSANAAGSRDPSNPIGYTYDHSLFIADYAVTHTVSRGWDELKDGGLIFGTTYTSGGVNYTLRAPSVGSNGVTGTTTPASNEWDAILDKNSEDIKNWNKMYSWGQDTYQNGASERALRGYDSARNWYCDYATNQGADLGFRPVLELPSTDTLGADGLTTVTLNLNGSSIGTVEGHITTGEIHLVTKKGESYTAPSSGGLVRPTGITGTNFKWQDSSGNRYEPGDTVPADETLLTALWEKDVPTATANDITATYTGSAVPDSAITGTASVEGSWSFKNAAPVNVADSRDNVTVVFTPADTDTYETVEDIIKVTINKATPTGTPAYTAITSGRKTLADADLSVGSITPAGGSIAWDLGDSQTVSANTAYNWTYTPADTDNYNNLTGSITPYVVSSGGGSGSGSTPTYPPTVKQPDEGGTVTVSPKNPEKGDTVTITPKPEDGYVVDKVTVMDKDGKPVEVTDNGDGSYSFTQPSGKVTVTVTFTDKTKVFFVDVFPGDYYYDAVLWAAKNGITGGVDDTHFAPNGICTRAQAVTFLWRAAGSPAPKNSMMPFADVKTGDYYYNAVLWAVENGITKGTGATTFSPDATCTRGQIVTFLWRALGSPAPKNSEMSFADVKTGDYYYNAVLWAVENGITNGTSDTAFSPGVDCTRSQIVTFLYRFFVK